MAPKRRASSSGRAPAKRKKSRSTAGAKSSSAASVSAGAAGHKIAKDAASLALYGQMVLNPLDSDICPCPDDQCNEVVVLKQVGTIDQTYLKLLGTVGTTYVSGIIYTGQARDSVFQIHGAPTYFGGVGDAVVANENIICELVNHNGYLVDEEDWRRRSNTQQQGFPAHGDNIQAEFPITLLANQITLAMPLRTAFFAGTSGGNNKSTLYMRSPWCSDVAQNNFTVGGITYAGAFAITTGDMVRMYLNISTRGGFFSAVASARVYATWNIVYVDVTGTVFTTVISQTQGHLTPQAVNLDATDVDCNLFAENVVPAGNLGGLVSITFRGLTYTPTVPGSPVNIVVNSIRLGVTHVAPHSSADYAYFPYSFWQATSLPSYNDLQSTIQNYRTIASAVRVTDVTSIQNRGGLLVARHFSSGRAPGEMMGVGYNQMAALPKSKCLNHETGCYGVVRPNRSNSQFRPITNNSRLYDNYIAICGRVTSSTGSPQSRIIYVSVIEGLTDSQLLTKQYSSHKPDVYDAALDVLNHHDFITENPGHMDAVKAFAKAQGRSLLGVATHALADTVVFAAQEFSNWVDSL